MKISIEGVTYTASPNKRYPYCEYWTVFCDEKKFATVEWIESDGWVATFKTKGLNSGMWMYGNGSKITIEDRIARLHETNKEFMKKVIFVSC